MNFSGKPLAVPMSEDMQVAIPVPWELAVLRQLVVRELKLQQRGTALGLVWSLASPLALGAVYLGVADAVLPGRAALSGLALLAALIPWTAFSGALCAAAHAPLTHAALLRGHRVPVRVTVAAAALAALPALLPGLALLALLSPGPALFALPALAAIQLALTAAAGLVLALLNTRVRDTQHALHYALRLGFFLTPVLWQPAASGWLDLNPLTGLIAAYRSVLVDGALPALPVSALVWATTLAAAGLALERRLGRRVVEYI